MANPTREGASRLVSDLGDSQGFSSALSALLKVDLESLSENGRTRILDAIRNAATLQGGSLLMLSLPPHVQTELALLSKEHMPGLDRSAYLKATPSQVVRRLSGEYANNEITELLLAKYNFSLFRKDDWSRYFVACSTPIAAAKSFLSKSVDAGGFSDDEITNLVMRNPKLVQCIPQARINPNTAVALLISGKAQSLWQTYDFTRLSKNHWRELLLHTNPDSLPEVCKPFVENRDGNGFAADELLNMARNCHALINSLDPNKVPFNVAYDLYLTGRADLLWKNYPFAMLDKSEWRKILANPQIRIPDTFIEVARSNRFKVDELCDLAIKNDKLLPVLVEIDVPPKNVVDLLLAGECDYLWAHYHFAKFGPGDWERLILGLRQGQILKPNAMSALSSCRDITEIQATRILNKDTVYCPHLPLASVSPDMVVEILMRGKGHFLWDKYDFSRLNDVQWLRLLGGITGSAHKVEEKFLVERASAVDNGQLNLALARREELIRFVDQQFIATDLAVDVLTRESDCELWRRYDFTRFDGKQLCRLLKKTGRTSDWPESLKTCFKAQGRPLTHGDLLEIAIDNPFVVIELLSTDWVAAMEDDQFGKLATVCVRKDSGRQAITSRLRSSSESWKDLGIGKLKRLLIAFPDAQGYVAWQSWSFATIASLIEADPTFESLMPHPIRFFFWKHAKSLAAMAALTVAAFSLISHQNESLATKDRQRRHWNGIVDSIRKFDQSRSYEELSAALSEVSAMDMSVISNDVFVKNAVANLCRWKVGRETVSRSMNQLRTIRDKGWQEANPSEVTNLILQVERCEYSDKTIMEEFSGLKTSWSRHLKEVEDRKRCAYLRDSLRKMAELIPDEEDLAKLERCRRVIPEAKAFAELTGLASEVETLADNRIAALRKEALTKSVLVVSNGVEQLCAMLRSQDGFDVAQALPAKRDKLRNEIGYEQYCKENGGRFEGMSAAIEQFQAMKSDSDEKMREARRLDEQFKKEFMTVEAGVTCSNLITACKAGIEKAKRLGEWKAPLAAYAAIKQIVDGIQSRDVRCWNLVDELNGATTYTRYLGAKNALVKEYGDFAQLSHLASLGEVTSKDAESYFKSPRKSFWGGEDKYRYHFVGVVRLSPEEEQKVYINVNNKSQVTSRADLYTLLPGSGGGVSSKLLVQQADNKYYKVDGVDYGGCQGAPLFVRSEHFIRGK